MPLTPYGRALMSKYRRQRGLSLDGHMRGVGGMRYRRNYNASPPGSHDYSLDVPGGADAYDPIRSIGYPASPGYEPPDSSDDPEFHGTTPPERFWLPNETAGIHETPVDYDSMLIFNATIDAIRENQRELHDQVIGDLGEGDAKSHFFQQLLDSMQPSNAVLGQYGGHEMTHELFERLMDAAAGRSTAPGVQEREPDAMPEFDSDPFAMVDAQFEQAMSQAAVVESDIEGAVHLPLEEIVQQNAPMPMPQEMYPDAFAFQEAMHEQQMRLMDPFNMMGPMG